MGQCIYTPLKHKHSVYVDLGHTHTHNRLHVYVATRKLQNVHPSLLSARLDTGRLPERSPCLGPPPADLPGSCDGGAP